MRNYEEYIKLIMSISENITTIYNTIIDEYNNPISIDVFKPLFNDIIDKLIAINDKLLFYNYVELNLNLNNIRITINKIIFIIHYIFIFQYIKNKYNYDVNNFDFFENKFNDMKNFFSADLILNESLIDKLKNYSLLKEDFSIENVIMNTEDIEIEFKICNGIKIINHSIFYTQTQIKKFINLVKITYHDKNFKKIQHYIKPSYNHIKQSYNHIKPSYNCIKSSCEKSFYDSCKLNGFQNKCNLKKYLRYLKKKYILKVNIFDYIHKKYHTKNKKKNISIYLLLILNIILIVSLKKNINFLKWKN